MQENETIDFRRLYNVAMKRGLFVKNLGIGIKIRQYATMFLTNKDNIIKRQGINSRIVELDNQYWAIDLLKNKQRGEMAIFLKMSGDRFFPVEKIDVGILKRETQLF